MALRVEGEGKQHDFKKRNNLVAEHAALPAAPLRHQAPGPVDACRVELHELHVLVWAVKVSDGRHSCVGRACVERMWHT